MHTPAEGTHAFCRIVLLGLVLTGVLLAPSAAEAQTREDVTVAACAGVLNEIMAIPARKIPEWLLSDAQGIAIIPNMVKGGFVVGVRFGRGVVLVRDAQGNWQLPQFVTMTGGSVGFQAGVQTTDVVLVFKSRQSVQDLMQGKFTIGADAAAAAGPLGRQATAATDAELKAEIYSYSRSRGLFAGVSVDGSILEIDHLANATYYRPAADGQNVTIPETAVRLVQTVARYAGATEVPASGFSVPASSMQPSSTQTIEPAPPVGTNFNSPPIAQRERVRLSLAASSQRLQNLVDANWKRYLALPNEIYRGGTPDRAILEQTLGRFESVAGNPAYQNLSRRSEFQETYELLQRYVQSASQTGKPLQLPAPPSTGSSGTSPQR